MTNSSILLRRLAALGLILFLASQACVLPKAAEPAIAAPASNRSPNVRYMTVGADATATPTPL